MKRYIDINVQKSIKVLCLTIVLTIFAFGQIGFSQDESKPVKKIKPILKLISNKHEDNSRTIVGLFSYKDKKKKQFFKVKGISLNFYVGVDSIINLGSFTTDANGEAICVIDPNMQLPKNEEGYIEFGVEFEGNDFFRSMSKSLELIDIQLDMSLEVIDSIKTISIKAEKILANNERVPLNEEEVPIFVQRMFSQLKIGEVEIEEGQGTFELPNDIPGDTLGMITLIAKFEDHDDFANVKKSEEITWGVVTSHHTIYHPRSLWTQVAPVWMIVTLSIMLLGVWGHYIFVIIEIMKLKKGKKVVPE